METAAWLPCAFEVRVRRMAVAAFYHAGHRAAAPLKREADQIEGGCGPCAPCAAVSPPRGRPPSQLGDRHVFEAGDAGRARGAPDGEPFPSGWGSPSPRGAPFGAPAPAHKRVEPSPSPKWGVRVPCRRPAPIGVRRAPPARADMYHESEPDSPRWRRAEGRAHGRRPEACGLRRLRRGRSLGARAGHIRPHASRSAGAAGRGKDGDVASCSPNRATLRDIDHRLAERGL